MTRKAFARWPGTLVSIIALAMVALAGWMLAKDYFLSGVLVEFAVAIALLGLGHRWLSAAQRSRRRAASEEVQI